MNVFAGINSLEDYESSTWGESFYDVEETYETSQQVIRSDPFDDNCLFGKIKFNHKGIVFIVSGGTEYTSIETPFFKYDEHARRFSHRVRDGILSVASAYPIHLILWCMGELGLAEEIIAFEEWDNLVKKKFLEREELDNIGHDCTPDDDKELWNLFRLTITECLPDEYKKLIQVDFYSLSKTEPIKDELIRKNPAIDTLVERLKLEKT